jgi:hypothetical protein
MSNVTTSEIEQIMERVRFWPSDHKLALVRKVLETFDKESRSKPRGRPVSELIGIGAGKAPPPDDEQVKQWIDDYRMEKYG